MAEYPEIQLIAGRARIVVRRIHRIELRRGNRVERVEVSKRQQIHRRELSVCAYVSVDPRPRLGAQHGAIARGGEGFAEAFIGEEPETLVAPVVHFRDPQRTGSGAAKEVLPQERPGRARRVIEKRVGIKRVIAVLVKQAPVKRVASRRRDHGYLRNASTRIRANRSNRNAELAGGVE